MLAEHVLSLATWLPIFGGIAVLATGSDRNADYARQLSLVIAVLTFIVTLPLYANFNSGAHAMQFVENHAWIEPFNIRYRLGIDGISLWLILLTSFSTVLVVISAWKAIEKKVAQ